MCRVARLYLAVLILQACVYRSLAQEGAVNSQPATRSLILNVTDTHGIAVRDLTKENFALFLNGKPAPVINAQYSLAPRRIVVLLDMSGSMAGETRSGKWRIAGEAVHDLLSQTPVESPIAVVTFAGRVHDVFDFSQGRSGVAQWLQENPDRSPKLKEKKTALFDAILAGLKLLGDAQPGDAIYAITDGGENASRASARQTEAALQQSGVRLFALLFAGQAFPGDREGQGDFLEMVRGSGGLAFRLSGRQRPGAASWDLEYAYDAGTCERIKAYTTELNSQVKGFWALEFTVPAPSAKSKVRLVVTDHAGKERKDIMVAHPGVLLSAK